MPQLEPTEAQRLLDQCWAMLSGWYEENYGLGYHKPLCRFVLSAEEVRALKIHSANIEISARVFIGIDNNILFGHEVIEQRRTPYIEAIIGQSGR